jgi:hypothetical protein
VAWAMPLFSGVFSASSWAASFRCGLIVVPLVADRTPHQD